MTVENQDNKKRVQGNGSTVDIPFSFRVLEESDLKVYYVTRATNVAVLKTQDVDYTVVLDDDGEGGTVTMSVAQPSTIDILLLNLLEYTQPADLPSEGNFNETAVEAALDRSRLIDIQIKEEVNRCLKLKTEDVLNTTSYAGLFITAQATADRQGRIIKWNAAGTEIEAGPTVENIDDLAEIAADISAVAAIAANVTTVAGIDTEVSDVALIDSQIIIVAALDSEIATLAAIAADISAVADIETEVVAVAGMAAEVATVAAITPPLASIAGLATAANQMIYTTASNTYATTALTAAARTVLDDASVSDMVNTLGGATASGAGGLARIGTPSFTTTIGVGGATASASGAGISFPATQSASTDPNTLDDYEEGTWTAILTSDGVPGTHTYTNQNGAYTKIGRAINCFVYMALSAKGGTMSGSFAFIGGFPFAARGQTGSRYGAVFTEWGAFASAMYHSGIQIQSGTSGYILKQTAATSGQALCAPADITNATYMGGPFYYESA
jgi:hypothetical protein